MPLTPNPIPYFRSHRNPLEICPSFSGRFCRLACHPFCTLSVKGSTLRSLSLIIRSSIYWAIIYWPWAKYWHAWNPGRMVILTYTGSNRGRAWPSNSCPWQSQEKCWGAGPSTPQADNASGVGSHAFNQGTSLYRKNTLKKKKHKINLVDARNQWIKLFPLFKENYQIKRDVLIKDIYHNKHIAKTILSDIT